MGYTPRTHVRDHAKVDLDILQVKILMALSANDTAYDIYSIGKNSILNDGAYMSIKHMASSNNRVKVPRYYQFASFYNDTNYADVMITMVFRNSGRYNKLYDYKMRTEAVFDMMVTQAVYMYAMECFWWALDACNTKKRQVAKYDEGVAFLIGSIEGPSIGFSDVDDGVMLYNIANKHCAQFGVCDDTYGVSKLAFALMTQLNMGKSAIQDMHCQRAEKHIIIIADMVLLPIFQSIVKYSLASEDYPPNSLDPNLAKGEAAALALLPIIDFYNEVDAITVAFNMILEKDVKPVKDGAHQVAKALEHTVQKLKLNCTYMGNYEQVEICEKKKHNAVQSSPDVSTVAAVDTSSGYRSYTSILTFFGIFTSLFLLN